MCLAVCVWGDSMVKSKEGVLFYAHKNVDTDISPKNMGESNKSQTNGGLTVVELIYTHL